VALLLGSGFFFFREYSYSAVALVILGAGAEFLLGLHPTASGFAVAVLVGLASALGSRIWSLAILAAAVATGLLIAWNAAFNSSFTSQFYGLTVYNNQGHWWAFIFTGVSLVGVNGFAWLLGGFLIEFYRQRTANKERDIVQRHNLRTALELAEQSQRFLIASDISQGVLQQVSGMLTLTDGARYAARLDPEVAPRTLDRLVALIRDSHSELRRLFDMLNRSVMVAAAPPNLSDLELLAVTLREAGYPTAIVHQGDRLGLIPSVELAIYRIVFDATENVQQHNPVGTSIDINFVWSGHGLQILVKDNGIEVSTRENPNAEVTGQEAAEEDLLALTQQVTGAGITGLRERAELFGGTVEAHIVPGVGFTVNALFPGVEQFSAEATRHG
jgi:signal transduction histidine kinase